MRTIEVTDDVFQKLQAVAVPFLDTPNSVIERLLAQAAGNGQTRRAQATPAQIAVPSEAAPDDGAYTYKRPVSFTFEGHSHPVSTFKEIYLHLCREMAKRHSDGFDRVLALRGRERAYFSLSREQMTHPHRIEGTNIFAETNFSAQNIMDRCRDLLSVFGYQPQSLSVELRPAGQ